MADEQKTDNTKLHNAHEHLRHEATSDDPEIVRERLRREELAKKRDLAESDEETKVAA